jgi:hypothetical protein
MTERGGTMKEVKLLVGAHDNINSGGCVMEYVSWLAGEPWSDAPECVHPVLAAVSRRVNDRLGDDERQELKNLIPLVMGTTISDEEKSKRVSVRCATWAAREVLHLVREQDRAVCEKAIEAAEGWLSGDVAHAAAYAAYVAAGDALMPFYRGLIETFHEACRVEGVELATLPIPSDWEERALSEARA